MLRFVQDWTNYVSYVLSVLALLGWEERSTKEQWCLLALLSLKRVAPNPTSLGFALKLVNLIPPHISWVLFELLPLCWSLEWASLCAGPLRAACLHLPQPFVFLGLLFLALDWRCRLGAGTPHSTAGTSIAEISLLILNQHTMDLGPAHFVSHRNSVQLVFSWFTRVVIL